jgi:hypothetical protein
MQRFVQEQETAAAWWDMAYGSTKSAPIDSDEIARLRALGYVESVVALSRVLRCPKEASPVDELASDAATLSAHWDHCEYLIEQN